jgi:hypothetical protein
MVTNEEGEIPARHDVIVEVDGEAVSRRNVALGPGDTERIEWTFGFDEPGEYAVGIRGERTVTVTVERTKNGATAPGDSEATAKDGDPTTPTVGDGWGGLVSVAVVLTTVLARRRR